VEHLWSIVLRVRLEFGADGAQNRGFDGAFLKRRTPVSLRYERDDLRIARTSSLT